MIEVNKHDVENLLFDHLVEIFSNLLKDLKFEEMKLGFNKNDPGYVECFASLLIFEKACKEMGMWDAFSEQNKKLIGELETRKKEIGKTGMEIVSKRTEHQKEEKEYLIYIIEKYNTIITIIP